MLNQKTDAEIIKAYTELKRKEKRYAAKQVLILKKAREKGITVSEKEIDEYLKLK